MPYVWAIRAYAFSTDFHKLLDGPSQLCSLNELLFSNSILATIQQSNTTQQRDIFQ